jgi:hypothetical protein
MRALRIKLVKSELETIFLDVMKVTIFNLYVSCTKMLLQFYLLDLI